MLALSAVEGPALSAAERPVRRLTDAALVGILIGLMVVLGLASAVITPGPSDIDTSTSSYSAGPSGTKAAYVTLGELGYRVTRSREAVTGLDVHPPATVLVLSGRLPPSAGDKRAIQQFLEAGGTVLATGSSGAAFLGFGAAGVEDKELPFAKVKTYSRLVITPVTTGAEAISMPEELPSVKQQSGYIALYGDSADRPVMLTATINRGRAIWCAASTPLTNAEIADAGNLQWLLNIAGAPGEKAIVFDEHYHGFTRSLWSYAAGTPLPWVALQLGLVALAAIVTFSRRHGPVRSVATDPRTSPMEFVDMLGALYRRAGARAAAVSTARTRLRRTLAAACGVPATSDDAALAATAGAKLGVKADDLSDLLASSEVAGGDVDLEADRALALTRDLQAWTAKLQSARRAGEISGGVT